MVKKKKATKKKSYVVGYNTVSQKFLDRNPITKWKGKWFKSKIVSAKNDKEAISKVLPNKTIYNVQPMETNRLAKNRSDKVRFIRIGRTVKVRKGKRRS